jgi:YihY family inner membrane protein
MAFKDRRLVKLVRSVIRRYAEDSAGYLASAIAYHAFLSLFPLLLLGLAVVGFLLAHDVRSQAEWVDRLSRTVPGLQDLIDDALRAVVRERAAAGVIAVVGLAWTGIGVVEAAGHALARVFRLEEHGSLLRKKLWSIGSLVALGLLALAATGLTGLATGLEFGGLMGVLTAIGAIVLGLALDLGTFLLGYRILVHRRGPPFAKLWKGALLAAGGWTILKLAGAWVVGRVVGNAAAVYGSFAAVIGVLFLLHLGSRLFLYGAELNAVLIEEEVKGEEPSKVTPAERGLVRDR